jgi:hypothetical protein
MDAAVYLHGVYLVDWVSAGCVLNVNWA